MNPWRFVLFLEILYIEHRTVHSKIIINNKYKKYENIQDNFDLEKLIDEKFVLSLVLKIEKDSDLQILMGI